MENFVTNFNLFMSIEPEKSQDIVVDAQDHNLSQRETPKYKKKPLKQIFRMNEKEMKKYSKKK